MVFESVDINNQAGRKGVDVRKAESILLNERKSTRIDSKSRYSKLFKREFAW